MIKTSPQPYPGIIPQPSVKRLRERRPKALSIAIATICTEGLVLAADQQTGTNEFKFYQQKVTTIPLASGRGAVVLGYAGEPADKMNVIFQQLHERLENQDKGRIDIENDLQQVLDATIPKTTKEGHQLLCGFADSGEYCLLKSYNRSISPIPVWDCIGYGNSALTHYLGAIFLDSWIHLPLYRAIPICIYLVAQAKKYVQWCGGPTDVVVLTQQGKVTQYPATSAFDATCDIVENCLNGILTSATDPDTSASQCEGLISALRTVLERQRATFETFFLLPQ
jgi:hypothetical protein